MSKILNHPDSEEIIKRLNNGASVRGIERWIKERYPRNKRLHLTSVTIQTFRKKYLQLEGKVLRDIQDVSNNQIQKDLEESRVKKIEGSKAYKEKISEIVDSKLDISRKILELDSVIQSRMEYWYNAVASGNESAAKGDKELRQFMDRQFMLLGQYKKYVEGLAPKSSEYNVNITVINDQISLIRNVIRECLSEFSPEVAIRFVEKLNSKLKETKFIEAPVEPVKLKELQEAKFEILESSGTDDKQIS